MYIELMQASLQPTKKKKEKQIDFTTIKTKILFYYLLKTLFEINGFVEYNT